MAAPEIFQAAPPQQETSVFAPDAQNADPRSLLPKQDNIFSLKDFNGGGGSSGQELDVIPRRQLFQLDLSNEKYAALKEKIAELPSTADQLANIGVTPQSVAEARERKSMADEVHVIVGTGPEGMGEAAALEVARRGGTVIGITRSEAGSAFVDKVKALGGKAAWIQADITKLTKDQAQELMEQAMQKGLELNTPEGEKPDRKKAKFNGLLVASGARDDDLAVRLEKKQYEDIMDANAISPALLEVAALRVSRRKAKVHALSSMAADGSVGQLNYVMAKGAIIAARKALVMEMRAQAMTTSPGLVYTPFVDDMTDEQREGVLVMTESNRELTPDEVGIAMAHMLSTDSELNNEDIQFIGRGDIVEFPTYDPPKIEVA